MTIRARPIPTTRADGRDHPYVERRPGVCGGEPVIVGTRFPVRSVVTSVYRLGLTPEEIVEAWPYLTLAHVHDALSFYHDHRRMIDRASRENREVPPKQRGRRLPALGSFRASIRITGEPVSGVVVRARREGRY